LGDFVIVVRIVRSILIAPLDLAVGRAEGEHARGPLVVAGAVFRVPVRAGVANALVERIGVRIVGRGLPHRRAAVLPPLLAVLPRLVARLARPRNGVSPPRLLAGVEVGRFDIAADAVLAAGRADDGEVADDERRDGDGLADGGLRDFALPRHFA